jgi:hypothetical protein
MQDRRHNVNRAAGHKTFLACLKGRAVGHTHVPQLVLAQAAVRTATKRQRGIIVTAADNAVGILGNGNQVSALLKF